MVFSSLLFLFRFLPIVLIIYFLAPKKLRNAILFLASLIFYSWGEPVYVCIMLFSTIADYYHGRKVDENLEKGECKKARGYVIADVIINLGILAFFKYGDFIIQNINTIFQTEIPLMNLPLPIGISFYTFQTMSYTIDVYRRKAKVQKNIISFGTYVALFPQLIAGPIVQYKTIAKELNHRNEDKDKFAYGIMVFLSGLGKKVLLANNIGLLWDTISGFEHSQLTVLTAWLGVFAYAFQIYFDFSGYSDMAIGLGSMFGFHFPENFHYPYESKSITEFWRRWHISLGSWFREYVYIPLGGNRKGFGNQIRNIVIVWLLTGIWHGASWNFVLWGAYFGVLLILEKLVLKQFLDRLPSILQHGYTMFFVLISWVIFAFEDMEDIGYYLKAMFGLSGAGFYNNNSLYLLYTNALLFLILIIGSTQLPKNLVKKYISDRMLLLKRVFLLGVFLISVAYLVDASYNPFLYFRF